MSKQITIDLSKLTEDERWSYEIMEARFELIDELIGISEPVDDHRSNGSRMLFDAVSVIRLETKRREMIPDFNRLQEKAKLNPQGENHE